MYLPQKAENARQIPHEKGDKLHSQKEINNEMHEVIK